MKIRCFMKSLLSLLTVLVLLCAALPALAEGAPENYTHTAVAASTLKIRKTASKSAIGIGSIAKGSTVYITEYGPEWCKIVRGSTQGYVLTQYLTNIVEVAPAPENTAAPEDESAQEDTAVQTGTSGEAADPEEGFTMDETNFEAKFHALALGTPNIYAHADDTSEVRFMLKRYERVDVGQISGDWCLIRNSDGQFGYVKTTKLFEWDRYDPYAGPIPNLDIYTNIIWTNKVTHVYSLETGEVLWTTNPAAAIAAWDKDDQGRYIVPIEREYGYVNEEDVAYVMPVKDWKTAESGDLLSVMTTFFAVGVHTLQYQGRNWNVRLGSTYISGYVLMPGQSYNQNDVIGPYSEPSGYKKAPILSSETDSGYGGGTCQVNTTFYIATIALPLQIDQRQVHQNVGMHYCKIGLDASVGGGSITLRMTNSMPYAIRYQYFVTDGVLTCAIFKY